jgi:hypothetical protein
MHKTMFEKLALSHQQLTQLALKDIAQRFNLI